MSEGREICLAPTHCFLRFKRFTFLYVNVQTVIRLIYVDNLIFLWYMIRAAVDGKSPQLVRALKAFPALRGRHYPLTEARPIYAGGLRFAEQKAFPTCGEGGPRRGPDEADERPAPLRAASPQRGEAIPPLPLS